MAMQKLADVPFVGMEKSIIKSGIERWWLSIMPSGSTIAVGLYFVRLIEWLSF